MGQRRPVAAAASGGWVLAAGVLAGCGTGGTSAGDALDVSLDGFVAAAERPTPATLCEPEPADAATTPPGLPPGLGSPDAAFLQSASTTVEAYAWTVDDADAARSLVAEATAAAAACTWSTTTAHDLDGDGVAETPGAEAQRVEEWSAGEWAGLRVLRTVTGSELVDRRLVADGEVVLLVVTRADGDDPTMLTPADDYLTAVAGSIAGS